MLPVVVARLFRDLHLRDAVRVAGLVSQCLFPRCDLPRYRGARSQHGVRMPSPVFWRALVAQVPTAAFSRRHNRNAAGELSDLHLPPPRFYTANTLGVHCDNAVLRSFLPSHRHGSHQPQRGLSRRRSVPSQAPAHREFQANLGRQRGSPFISDSLAVFFPDSCLFASVRRLYEHVPHFRLVFSFLHSFLRGHLCT